MDNIFLFNLPPVWKKKIIIYRISCQIIQSDPMELCVIHFALQGLFEFLLEQN